MYPAKQTFKRSVVVMETEVFKLHKLQKPVPSKTPIFVISAHAGRHGNICQNILDTCVDDGRLVYTYELKSATYTTKDTSIEDLVKILHDCCQYIGEPVEVIGLCQGAWLGALFTARFPEMVTKYANFVGPINTQTGRENNIEEYMKRPGILEYHRWLVAMNGGIQRGMFQWLAFSMVDPYLTYVDRWMTYGQALLFSKEKDIEKWERDNTWHDDDQDLAGVWFLQCLDWHFKNNRIYKGTFPDILGGSVNLKNITCPVYLFGGGTDLITHSQQVFDMEHAVGSTFVHKELFEGAGHTKSFCGKEELERFKMIFLD